MPQTRSSTPKISFNQGLITEAHELNFPEGATTDELNMDLLRDGSRRRRRGIQYESNYVDLALGYTEGDVVHTHKWLNAGSVQGLVFVVLQVSNKVYFFSTGQDTLSTQRKSFEIDLEDFQSPYGDYAGDAKLNVTSIKGRLVVVSPNIDSFLVEYDSGSDSISTSVIDFRVRDFEWQGDRSTYDEGILITDPSLVGNDDRRYDTKNCGWVPPPSGSNPLTAYIGSTNKYPALTHSWFSGKNSSEVFSVAEWQKVYSGSTLIENGHYILSLWDQDRRTASSLLYVSNYIEQSRFSTVTSFGGRLFYSGLTSEKYSNAVFFSQILDSFNKAGELLQQNDPTSELVPDLLATDGGVIYLEGAYNIRKIHVFGPYLLVFAENGVWQIRGTDNIFKATDYAVTRISDVGLKYEGSFVSAQGRPYWWSVDGIFTLTVSEEQQVLTAVNLSLDTIQSRYETITKRTEVRGSFDRVSSRVFWSYPAENESVVGKLREVLIFDERNRAFVPWTVSDDLSYIADSISLDDDSVSSVEFEVIDSTGDTVVDASGDIVTVTRYGQSFFSTSLKFLCVTSTGGISFAEFIDVGLQDWGSQTYDSYLVTSYDFQENLTTKKSGVYVTSFLQATPIDTSSSCLLSALWDFRREPSVSGEQVYKFHTVPFSENSLVEDYPLTVVVTRTRLRGRGREVQLKFESDGDNDFHLLGFDMITARNTSL